MAAVSTLVSQVRRYMGDLPQLDQLAASLSTAATTITVNTNPTSNLYIPNRLIQVEDEAMLVRTNSTATSTMTVYRGWAGSTTATHPTSTTVYVNPQFTNVEILDALNYAQDMSYPYFYKSLIDETTTLSSNDVEYDVPGGIRHINFLEIQDASTTYYYKIRNWSIVREVSPYIRLGFFPVDGATMRVFGYGPFGALTLSGNTDAQFTAESESTLVLGAAEYLLASGEARRVRNDTGLVDQRENANRVGSSMSASNALLSRFERSLIKHAYPPLPKTVQSVWFR